MAGAAFVNRDEKGVNLTERTNMNLPYILSQANNLYDAGKYKEALGAVNVGLILFPRHPALIALFHKIPCQYDDDFYGNAYSVSYNTAKLFFQHLQGYFAFESVVDVGAGVGAWSHAAHEMDKKVISIDGDWVSSLERQYKHLQYRYQNLNDSVSMTVKSDLAVCVEVAEHLVPERSKGIVSDLCSLAPVVIFGAALPRQGGSGHINCRPHSFWIEAFSKENYIAFDIFRPQFWYDGRVGPWYAQNTYLFVAQHMSTQFNNAPRPSLVDVYHPKIVVDSPICLQDHLQGILDPGAGY